MGFNLSDQPRFTLGAASSRQQFLQLSVASQWIVAAESNIIRKPILSVRGIPTDRSIPVEADFQK